MLYMLEINETKKKGTNIMILYNKIVIIKLHMVER